MKVTRQWFTAVLATLSAAVLTGTLTGGMARPAWAQSEDRAKLEIPSGNPERGKAVFIDRTLGHCLLCHSVQSLAEPSQGNIGPALDNVANRLSEAQLRLRLIDSTKINPDSAMPAYYRKQGLTQVAREFTGKTVLSAKQLEDVLAYLLTLRQPSRLNHQQSPSDATDE